MVAGLALGMVSFTAHAAPAVDVQEVLRMPVGASTLVQYRLTRPDGPPVDYFLSQPAEPAPLVLLIQGSGCTPGFTGLGTPQRTSHVFRFIDLAREGKVAVMTVNKPHSPAALPDQQGGATACPDQFNAYFTLETWTRDLRAAFDHAQRQPSVRPGGALALGVSEGATAAAALAAQDSRISHAALLGGDGAGQFYDLVIAAYRDGKTDEERKALLEQAEHQRRQIMAAPDDAKSFAWGHPYKRWASFFRASPLELLKHSRASVYIASGMQDRNVPVLSAELLASELAAAGRDVTMRRIPDAGHGLTGPASAPDALEKEYARILRWYGSH